MEKSTSIVWPTLGSRTAKEQNRRMDEGDGDGVWLVHVVLGSIQM